MESKQVYKLACNVIVLLHIVSVYVIGRFLTVLACATETMRRLPIGIELAARNLPCFFISQNPCDVTKTQENHELQPLRHVWHRHIYSEI